LKKVTGRESARVLLISNGIPPKGQWGTEFYTHQLACGLQARGRDVAVFLPIRDHDAARYSLRRTSRHGLDLFEFVNCGDPQKGFVDSYQNDGVERAFARVLEEFRPEVVHFNHLLWGLSIGLPRLAAEAGARVITTVTDLGLLCHKGQFFDSNLSPCEGPRCSLECSRCVREPSRFDAEPAELFIRRAAVRGAAKMGGLGRIVVASDIERRAEEVRAAARFIDRWVFPTRALQGEFHAHGLALEGSSVLPYGIDEEAFQLPRVPDEEGGFRFSFFGQFMPHKGLETLFKAVRKMESRLPESVSPWRLSCFGHGSLGRHHLYARRAFELVRGSRRVMDSGCFPPLDAPLVMAETDALIVPSVWMENAPLTVLQARATGVPVIASDVSGIREVMEPGVHGVLVPPGDESALADAMRAAILAGPARYAPDPVVGYAEHLDQIEALYGERTELMTPLVQEEVEVGEAVIGSVEV
jgi:glycosyltransferase involved in cell wall biosynthesis